MQSLPLSAQTRLLVVAPHPDDETLGCGVLIQQVLAAGGIVHLLLLTDGDNNPWPQRYIERRLRIGHADRQRWGARRRREAMHAIGHLGLSADALEPQGWLDMDVTRRLRDDTSASVAALQRIISSFGPTLVCFPALEDSHPDHGAAHVLCRLALAGVSPAPVQWAYPVHSGGDLSEYPIRIDATPEQQQRKLQALTEHRSQMVLSGGRMRRLALSPERYMLADVAGDARLPWQPPAILHRSLRVLIATSGGVRDVSWQDAPVTRDESGCYRWEWPSSQPSAQAATLPGFVKLHLDWPSPWIFDHWGWHAL
jgi:LmbE family N-acetylglucosaminyl deacetylase